MKSRSKAAPAAARRVPFWDAAVRLLGISYEFWSLALFVAMGMALFRLLRQQEG